MVTIITITGDLGSGKSTVSNLLKESLQYDYIYTGSIQRKIANKYNMTTLELNKYAETHPEIDEEIDATFRTLNESSRLIVDSRLAWFFIPHSYKVYLQTDLAVSIRRISDDAQRVNERYTSVDDAADQIMARKKSENKRYMELYGANCDDLSHFDLIIDTTNLTPDQVADKITTAYQKWIKKP